MSSSLSDSVLEKKFQGASNTQDSIQTLSLWLIHHKSGHQKIVASWMKVLQKAKIGHRLTLFYLANDVIQNSKRKGFLLFVNSFAEVLREATLLVRDDQIRPNIQRVFSIWEQRNVYNPEFIADLQAILANSKVPASAPSKLLADFKPEMVIKKMKSLVKLESEASSKQSAINFSKLNATESEIVQQFKDRIHGQQFSRDFDKNIRQLEELVEFKLKEVNERSELILLLEQSGIYYDTQRGEAKIVANAYKNFDGRVKNLAKKVLELIPTFPSPVPSPSVDAPSPTPSDLEAELDLPNDNAPEKELENLEDAPSPVGSPEGLNLSPDPKEGETKAQPATTSSVGNPIPTLSNFFSHAGQTGMTSLLDAFSNNNDTTLPSVETKKETVSLDNRLSSFLQNIPNLPCGLQSTIFANVTGGSSNSMIRERGSSPIPGIKDKDSTHNTDCLTPVKDEASGQNTPLQDEDTHSNHSFFSKLATAKPQSPKDFLKGLTSLIHSASSEKDDNQKKEKKLNCLEQYDQPSGMSSFLKNIIPAISDSPQQTSSSSFLAPDVSTTTTSYQTSPFNTMPCYSTQPPPPPPPEQDLSFIPSLVPSMPQVGFTEHSYPSDEYNPELEIFNTDMEIDDQMEDNGRNIEVPSPEMEPLSPVGSGDSNISRAGPPTRRLSTLITVVTEDSENVTSDNVYKSDKENVAQEPIQPWVNSMSAPIPSDIVKNSPTEEFFIGKPDISAYFTAPPPHIGHPNGENRKFDMEPPLPYVGHPNGENRKYDMEPPPPYVGHPNGENRKYDIEPPPQTDIPLSHIQTVQSQREDANGRWFNENNNWNENHRAPPPMRFRPAHPEGHFFNQNNFSPPPCPPRNFHPRPDWSPRPRPNHSFQQKNHPYNNRHFNPHQNKGFPFRGRGWGRSQPHF